MSTPHKCRHDAEALAELQSYPLPQKILESQQRVAEWVKHYGEDGVYVAFSGGKDSTVLLHLVRSLYHQVPAVFCDTGLEFPEIREFVKSVDNVEFLRPKMSFKKVIETYGFPMVSKEQAQFINEARNTNSDKLRNTRLHGNKSGRGKVSKKWKYLIEAPFEITHKCCHVMKKEPSSRYERQTGRKPFLGTMAVESQLRRQKYIKEGCNAFASNRPTSTPMAFWTEEDIWAYIRRYKVAYSSIYNKGEDRTGCMFCGFGCHKDSPNRFEKLASTHPKLHAYCMNNLGMKEVLEYMGLPTGCEH